MRSPGRAPCGGSAQGVRCRGGTKRRRRKAWDARRGGQEAVRSWSRPSWWPAGTQLAAAEVGRLTAGGEGTAPHPYSPTDLIVLIMPPAKNKQKHSSHAARVSRSPKNTRVRLNKTKKKNHSNSPPLVQVLHPKMYVETTVLLPDKIFATICPKKCEGHLFRYSVSRYDEPTNRFTVKYEIQTILHDGVSFFFLSDDDGKVEIMGNVKLEVIQRGADRYNAALGQISEHRIKEKVVVAKLSLCRKTTLTCCERWLISTTSPMQQLPRWGRRVGNQQKSWR